MQAEVSSWNIRAVCFARESSLPFQTRSPWGAKRQCRIDFLRLLDAVDVRDQHDVDAGIEALLDAGLVVRAGRARDREAATLGDRGHLRAERCRRPGTSAATRSRSSRPRTRRRRPRPRGSRRRRLARSTWRRARSASLKSARRAFCAATWASSPPGWRRQRDSLIEAEAANPPTRRPAAARRREGGTACPAARTPRAARRGSRAPARALGQKEVGSRGHHEIGRGDRSRRAPMAEREELDAGGRHLGDVVRKLGPDVERARALVRARGLDGARLCGAADGHDDRVRAERKRDRGGHRGVLRVGGDDADQPVTGAVEGTQGPAEGSWGVETLAEAVDQDDGAGRTARVAS